MSRNVEVRESTSQTNIGRTAIMVVLSVALGATGATILATPTNNPPVIQPETTPPSDIQNTCRAWEGTKAQLIRELQQARQLLGMQQPSDLCVSLLHTLSNGPEQCNSTPRCEVDPRVCQTLLAIERYRLTVHTALSQTGVLCVLNEMNQRPGSIHRNFHTQGLEDAIESLIREAETTASFCAR